MQTTAPTPTGRGAPGQNRVCVRRTPSAGVSYGRHNRLSGLARASGTGPGASRPAGKPVQQVAASPLPADAAAVRAGLTDPVNLGIAAGVGLAGYGLYKLFDTPSRPYQNNVGQEYDAWTEEGILEYYWGEHIHLGYYNKEEMAAGYKKKNFIQAKYDFVDEMLAFSGAALPPPTVLDVGCGIGGTTRHLAAKFPTSKLTGITLSPNQVKRATELAAKRGLSNVNFRVMDALKMDFPDNSFDLVWACESGEHMPDKAKFIAEMTRVLKPGGTLVIACWCQRDETPERPFSEQDKKDLKFLYEEWAHPYFISIEEFERIMKGMGGKLESVGSADWTEPTIASWRHSIWVGVWDPWIVVSRPKVWYKTMREIVTLERMHQAFDKGLMQYGMVRATKAAAPAPAPAAADSKVAVGAQSS